ncbi:GtrA-like protein [Chlamydia trachomatis]|nr:GtrA-like protein [Chlamydia trachomatis]
MKKLQSFFKNQKIKFATIGAFNTALDFAILFSLKALGINVAFSNIVSTGVTFILSFILNKKITFNSTNKTKQENIKEFLSFTIITLFGLWVIQTLVIYIITSILSNILISNITLFIAKIIATIFSLIWNFVLYKKVVFKK